MNEGQQLDFEGYYSGVELYSLEESMLYGPSGHLWSPGSTHNTWKQFLWSLQNGTTKDL